VGKKSTTSLRAVEIALCEMVGKEESNRGDVRRDQGARLKENAEESKEPVPETREVKRGSRKLVRKLSGRRHGGAGV